MSKSTESITLHKVLEVEGQKVVYRESFVIPYDYLGDIVAEETDFDDVEDFLANYVPDDDGQMVYDMAEGDGMIEHEETYPIDSGSNTPEFIGYEEDEEALVFNGDSLEDEEDLGDFDEDEDLGELGFEELSDRELDDFINGEPVEQDSSDNSGIFEQLPEID